MSCTVDHVLDLAKRQIGYTETGTNHTKYSAYFDDPKGAWQWFCTKAQGCEWCSIFICWLFCQNEIMGPKKARSFLGCPEPDMNFAKVVKYLWQYMDKKGYKVSGTTKPGDIIFFKNSKGISHVGIIEKVDDKNIISIEGNKGNAVKRVTHGRTVSTIYGFMRPKYEAETTTDSGTKPVTLSLIDQLAYECIQGKYGNYPDRKHRINALGYGNIYTQVQKRVNLMLYGR